MVLGILIIIVALVELTFSPRLDKTSEEEMLLWYNKNGGREYIKLW